MEQLVIVLDAGEVTIRLRPDLAPAHVVRITELAAEGFYDGAPFGRVNPEFMAQVTPTKSSGKPDLAAEFTDARHRRGVCSMARGVEPDSANNQFFIMTNAAAFIECQYTIWGEVVDGLEHIDHLPAGEPPERPGRIRSLRLMEAAR